MKLIDILLLLKELNIDLEQLRKILETPNDILVVTILLFISWKIYSKISYNNPIEFLNITENLNNPVKIVTTRKNRENFKNHNNQKTTIVRKTVSTRRTVTTRKIVSKL